jgi:hypothetical protein
MIQSVILVYHNDYIAAFASTPVLETLFECQVQASLPFLFYFGNELADAFLTR